MVPYPAYLVTIPHGRKIGVARKDGIDLNVFFIVIFPPPTCTFPVSLVPFTLRTWL